MIILWHKMMVLQAMPTVYSLMSQCTWIHSGSSGLLEGYNCSEWISDYLLFIQVLRECPRPMWILPTHFVTKYGGGAIYFRNFYARTRVLI